MFTTMNDLLNLFDDIPYKYMKNIINDDDEVYEVGIEHIDCYETDLYKTRFIFKISQGKTDKWDLNDTYKKFVVDKEYSKSSTIGLFIRDLVYDE